jgi:hypothetical protein
LEKYLLVNLLGPGPLLIKKRIYRAAVLRRLRNTALGYDFVAFACWHEDFIEVYFLLLQRCPDCHKITLQQATKAQRGSRVITPLFL